MLQVLTLGGVTDLPDALGLCHAILVEFKRRRARTGLVTDTDEWFDEGNVLGELQAYIWILYDRWNPNYHQVQTGRGNNFRGYATAILRQKVKTFVARDTGEAAGGRKVPKAHSYSVSTSWEGLVEQTQDRRDTGGLDGLVAVVAGDPTFDRVASRSWVDATRGGTRTGVAAGNGCAADAGAAQRHTRAA
jgi:hypothetical protein